MAIAALLFGLTALVSASCGSSDNGSSGSGSGASGPTSICLLHNCESDAECGACDNGRTTCLVQEKRCVACDPMTMTGCPDGQSCSSWGICAPSGATCPTDMQGTPQIACSSDDDCHACDPAHQICDTSMGTCVGCTDTNKTECQTTDVCTGDTCVAACPATCTSDADCASCGSDSAPAHVCNGHICATCSPTSMTTTCGGGTTCTPKGTCEPHCGSDGLGTCTSDADCANCGGDATTCHPSIAGPGKCGPNVPGCSDLGSAAVLPAPFDKVTNLCSSDADCADVSANIDIGAILRDITGIGGIGDATIEYPMHACAALTVGSGASSVSCGVCVPCREDSDCEDIDIDKLAGEAFGPIGSIAAAFLLDQVFGPDAHTVHMFCETIAGDYGVCIPCPGILYDCGYSSDPGTGSCAHDVCTSGAPLNASCSSCTKTICEVDTYCCDKSWDNQCMREANTYCNSSCKVSACAHDECVAGAALDATCSSCAQMVCASDGFCCDQLWDAACVGAADTMCGLACP